MSISHDYARPRKKVIPKFHDDSPELPSIDQFKLAYILSHDVKKESQDVVDSLLKVTQNYQADLKNEIRNKLSVEQKIQYKNIDIAMLSRKLNKVITHRSRRLEKVYSSEMHTSSSDITTNSRADSQIDADLDLLLQLSAHSSSLIKKLCTDLSEIDKKVNRSRPGSVKYPMISKYLAITESFPGSVVSSQNEEQTANVIPKQNGGPSKTSSNFNGATNLNITSSSNGEHILKTPSSANGGPITPEQSNPASVSASLYQSLDSVEADMSDPETFESFMSSTISKYRNLQLESHKSFSIFPPPETESKTTSPSKGNNPLNLLYSSIIAARSTGATASFSPNNLLNIKSIPTVELTPQVSHFKKLRINGSPITSATFARIREKELKDRGEEAPMFDECLAVDEPSLDSHSLHEIETDVESDEEPILTSESSDLSSDSDVDSNTYQYYVALRSDLQKKKRNHRRRIYQSSQFRKEASPTPKHKPSHHILKPKRSILKMPKNETRRAFGVRVRSPSRSRSPKMEIKRKKSVDKKPKTVSAKNPISVIEAHDYVVKGIIEGKATADLKSKLQDLL